MPEVPTAAGTRCGAAGGTGTGADGRDAGPPAPSSTRKLAWLTMIWAGSHGTLTVFSTVSAS